MIEIRYTKRVGKIHGFSLAFVLDTLTTKVQSYEKDTIRLGEEITCYQYLAEEQIIEANKE